MMGQLIGIVLVNIEDRVSAGIVICLLANKSTSILIVFWLVTVTFTPPIHFLV